ncbi:MAG TPA: cytochrome c [Methylibium sp.]|nr:cytochrome c [Methylibium sp.]
MRHVALVVLALLAGGPAAAADAVEPAPVPTLQDLANPEWIAAGRERFVSACAYCHGQQGEAGKVKSFKERPGWDPQRIHDVIADGRTRAGNVMPPWKGSIPDAEIWRIVAYIKSLTPGETVGRP